MDTGMTTEAREVLKRVIELRRERREKLSGTDRMMYNLVDRLRGWMLREDGYRCVTVGEILTKVQRYAPKKILQDKELVREAVENIWGITHGYTIASAEWMNEDFELELDNL